MTQVSHSAAPRRSVDTVVLDVDGTLVDTVYHHVLACDAAFAEVHVHVPMWRLHRAIGMGGDRLVAEVAGDEVEVEHGDRVRSRHDERFGEMLGDIHALPGARGPAAYLAGAWVQRRDRQLGRTRADQAAPGAGRR